MEMEQEEQRQYEEAIRQEELEEKRKAKLAQGLTVTSTSKVEVLFFYEQIPIP